MLCCFDCFKVIRLFFILFLAVRRFQPVCGQQYEFNSDGSTPYIENTTHESNYSSFKGLEPSSKYGLVAQLPRHQLNYVIPCRRIVFEGGIVDRDRYRRTSGNSGDLNAELAWFIA
jgi:hypothetical protein